VAERVVRHVRVGALPVPSHALARGVDGYRSLSRAIGDARLAGSGKGRAVYDLEDLAARADGRWAVLTGCRKGLVPAALARGGEAEAARELERLRALFGADNVVVVLIDHDRLSSLIWPLGRLALAFARAVRTSSSPTPRWFRIVGLTSTRTPGAAPGEPNRVLAAAA